MRWTGALAMVLVLLPDRVMARRLAGRAAAREIGQRLRSGSGAPITAYGIGALGKSTWRARSSYPREW
ncbi:hypothetical protein GCM10010508_67300 [Streptomyces naganishii JCM 4654]|uniref:Uncharacterized protein n=1 Tax=Streptomyces naganishii JCM 4654 TaxID=1306179 RepID=A0A918YBA9_9ACTN|nr:hypothetical protein GCM10010508_67300 [Streptomyces naganishii JCM 4654]